LELGNVALVTQAFHQEGQHLGLGLPTENFLAIQNRFCTICYAARCTPVTKIRSNRFWFLSSSFFLLLSFFFMR
jgi:hypothetical protein